MERLSGLRILIVEDEKVQALTLSSFFKHNLGAEVETAGSCEDAREKMAESAFDLITLDFQLPDGDGLELLGEINSNDDPPPVIMVTGHGDERTAVEAFRLGASGYVVKDKRMSTMIVEEAKSALAKAALKRTEADLRESREELKNVYEGIIDGVLVADHETRRFVRTNAAACEMFGHSENELLALGIADIHPADELGHIFSLFEMIFKGETSDARDIPCMRKDGSVFYADLRGSQIIYRGRSCALAVFRDITERKKAEQELKDSEELFRKHAESGSAGVIIYQGNKFVYVNDAVVQMTGYTRDELLSMDFWEVAEPGFREQVKERGKARQRGEKVPTRYMFPFVTKIGEHRFSDFSAADIEYQGAPAGIATIIDITHLINIGKELRAANAELQGFARTVSHDLRAPLAAARTGCEVFLQLVSEAGGEIDQDLVSELPAVVHRSLVKACDLVDDLLALAVSNQADGKAKPVDVKEVMSQIADENEAEMRRRGGSLHFDDEMGIVLANPTHVYQVFSNLVRNAFEHNTASVPIVEVHNLGDEAPGIHRYMVRDNGAGIPESMMDRLFDPFLAGPGGGTGIGLSIVSKIVSSCGGEIEAFSDGGACFEFTLLDGV
ncbi:MAG TPA: PAS domain S-box protein [Candidatus Anoxymicrobiaceae bacterium]